MNLSPVVEEQIDTVKRRIALAGRRIAAGKRLKEEAARIKRLEEVISQMTLTNNVVLIDG